MINAFKWGMIFSLASLLWTSLEYLAGLHGELIEFHAKLTNLFVIPAVLIMYLGLSARKRELNGIISYTEVLRAGIAISLVVAIMSPAVLWLFVNFVNPDYFGSMIRYSVKTGFYANEKVAAEFFYLQQYALISATTAPVVGTVTSAILGIFIRSKVA